MPKVKTRKSVSKRFSVTKNGKVKRSQAKMRHLMTCKSRNKKRNLGRNTLASAPDAKNIKKMMPYG